VPSGCRPQLPLTLSGIQVAPAAQRKSLMLPVREGGSSRVRTELNAFVERLIFRFGSKPTPRSRLRLQVR